MPFPDDFADCSRVIRAKKANPLCLVRFRREKRILVFERNSIMYSGAKYPFQLSPHCGENLIVGESLHSTEVMNVVEVSKAKDLKNTMRGDVFLLICSDSSLHIRARGCMFITKIVNRTTTI